MRKNEYDFYVDDQVTFNKYQLTLKCKYHTKISILKQYLLKYIKKNFDIMHNDVTLKESMTLDEVFSRYCQNTIILLIKQDPMIDVLVKHSIQYQNLRRSRPTSNEALDEIFPLEIKNDQENMKNPVVKHELDTLPSTTQKKCSNCGIQNKMIENYESSISNLIQENEQLQLKMRQLKEQRNISKQKESIAVNSYRQLKRS
ncbi:unnamed protein product [Paramecium octaurelia]|uniref:Uncharacterized protein n=1 Tax=Paramecium octaurelia TaxID=43137 RepID=A0A8S1VGA7_PAROT|nr:unnamed protein product [Paramecium octaurelia]